MRPGARKHLDVFENKVERAKNLLFLNIDAWRNGKPLILYIRSTKYGVSGESIIADDHLPRQKALKCTPCTPCDFKNRRVYRVLCIPYADQYDVHILCNQRMNGKASPLWRQIQIFRPSPINCYEHAWTMLRLPRFGKRMAQRYT